MNKIFVIERMIAPGIWELLSETFYLDKKEAQDDCSDIVKFKRKTNTGFAARVTELEINKQ